MLGKNIYLTKESSKFGTSKRNKWIHLHKTKSRLVMITAPREEFVKVFPNAHIVEEY